MQHLDTSWLMKSEEWKRVGPTAKAFASTFVKGLPGHEESNANKQGNSCDTNGMGLPRRYGSGVHFHKS